MTQLLWTPLQATEARKRSKICRAHMFRIRHINFLMMTMARNASLECGLHMCCLTAGEYQIIIGTVQIKCF